MFAARSEICVMVAFFTLAVTAHAANAPKDAASLKANCSDFAGRNIDAKAIGLPTRGGTIKAAEIATLGTASLLQDHWRARTG